MNSKTILTFFIVTLLSNKCLSVESSKSRLLKHLLNNKADKHDHDHGDLPNYDWFIKQIFERYSDETYNFSSISQADFEDIMDKLNIEYHDHDHDHMHPLAKLKSDNYSLVSN
jgi:hypothetical protein